MNQALLILAAVKSKTLCTEDERQDSVSYEITQTLMRCLLTHFVKVFFCTLSRSSEERRERKKVSDNPKSRMDTQTKSSSVPTVWTDWFVEQNLSSFSHTLTDLMAYLTQNIKNIASWVHTTPLRGLHHTFLISFDTWRSCLRNPVLYKRDLSYALEQLP